jgi:hypothetical protein
MGFILEDYYPVDYTSLTNFHPFESRTPALCLTPGSPYLLSLQQNTFIFIILYPC